MTEDDLLRLFESAIVGGRDLLAADPRRTSDHERHEAQGAWLTSAVRSPAESTARVEIPARAR
jgi:hypothetical protein